ncbi:cyanobacterial porin [Gloeocapsa sp. PCC 7428]|uniref:iron uptake porin n=1 Tax=Gloeocapsa sp. PCC 7428 TaxID=1173026 RepID=UPI0002A5F1CD|nr:iron uptake porin [Gloeocapsa sp. PCC 7428]AFZ32852.1 cyanobacterial porin [Gloeocapsa sp. PCC 7428]
MTIKVRQILTHLTVIGVTSFLTNNPVSALGTSNTTDPLAQVTSVSQLSDVAPSDWAFQSLSSLVERYGCIAGYPDGTYRGNRALTRYEFAAGLNACLAQINSLITSSTADAIRQEDIVTLQRLQTEFAQELTVLRGRVDQLEARTAELEAQQFSTTTKLEGEVVFAVNGVTGDRKADGSDDEIDDNLILAYRTRLDFNTSFSGTDNLRVRLQARNIPEFEDAAGTPMANLGIDGSSGSSVELSRLDYFFPVGERASGYVTIVGGGLGDFVTTVNPLLSSSGDGAVSLFGRENPIRRQGSAPGASFFYELSDAILFEVGYAASDASDSEVGIWQSPYAAVAQLTVQPSESLNVALTYIRSYNSISTGTGSELSNDPFDDEAETITGNSYGVEAALQVSPKFTLGGRVGWIQATATDLDNNPSANIFTWAVSLAFPDLAGEDNLAGIIIGVPPKVVSNEFDADLEEDATSLHLEAFYRFQVNDNLAITPGVFMITNPEHDADNDTIYVGTVRTTFEF